MDGIVSLGKPMSACLTRRGPESEKKTILAGG